ncbi:MAG: type III-A CRISPR-associated RAMP protein Csm4 [bacterium]
MKTFRVKLVPASPLNGIPASETLFGALCWGIRTFYGESRLINLLDDFEGDPNRFVVSSAFPLLSPQIYMYPMPILPEIDVESMKKITERYEKSLGGSGKERLLRAISSYKQFKKIRYIEEEILQRILKGEGVRKLFEDYLTEERFDEKSGMLLVKSNGGRGLPKDLIKWNQPVQKNAIDRFTMSTSGEGQLYYTSETSVGRYVSLYFLIMTDDIDFFEPILRWMHDTGIGGNRTAGKGHFRKVDVEEVETLPRGDGDQFITLSRYLPKPGEIDLGKARYELLPYWGRVESMHFRGEDIWKDRVVYFKEGSVFEAERREYYGQLVDVKRIGGATIKQNGLAFPLFGKVGE